MGALNAIKANLDLFPMRAFLTWRTGMARRDYQGNISGNSSRSGWGIICPNSKCYNMKSNNVPAISFGKPSLIALGDGSFRAAPGKPVKELTVALAAQLLGIDKATSTA